MIWVGQFSNDEKTQVRVFLIKFLSDKSILLKVFKMFANVCSTFKTFYASICTYL